MTPVSMRTTILFVMFILWLPAMAGGDDKSDLPGFMVEIAVKIFESKGHTVDYDIMPWARAIQDTRKGKYNAIIGAGKEDAPDFIFPAIEQAQMVNVFYVRKGFPWQYAGVASFKDNVLGVIKDYTYVEEIDVYISENAKNSKRVQIVSGDTALDSNIKKLLAERVDILIEDSNVMGQYIKKNLENNVIQAAGKLPPDALFIAFSPVDPRSAAYADILSKGMVALRESGDLKAILAKYGLEDWQ